MTQEDELARLREELASTKRELAELERVVRASEHMAECSEHAMRESYAALERHVEELHEAKVAAEQAALAKSRFLAVMSHELRTPLNGIVGSAELLKHAELPPEQLELTELLHRSGTSLLAIVNDVLDYSRLEAGALPLESIAFDVRELTHDVRALHVGIAEEKGVELQITVADDVPSFVLGDPTRVRQVLLNLLHNAMKFTVRGRVSVHVARAEAEHELRFEVADTGIGIAADVLPKLFTAFVQADATTTRRFGGTGLGLAICSQLVQRMGGRIGVRSAPGMGSTFEFTCVLPEVSADDAATQLGTDDHHEANEILRDCRVLIVDDHDANRLLIRRMLERLGGHAEEACDGVEALQKVGYHDFDLVLMDVSMPVMNGIDATEEIRRLPPPRGQVPILALTANALPEDRERCLSVGMDGYLSKPVRLAALRTELQRVRQHTADRHS